MSLSDKAKVLDNYGVAFYDTTINAKLLNLKYDDWVSAYGNKIKGIAIPSGMGKRLTRQQLDYAIGVVLGWQEP